MKTHDIQSDKLSLINWISQLQDKSMIDILKTYLPQNEDETTDTSWHKEVIEERLNNLKEEDLDEWEDVKNRLDKKYNA